MDFKDYYDILGVEPDASQEDIRRAYRKLARKYHPDVSDQSDAETRFKEVSEAYEVLKDPEKRETFDQARAQPQGGAAPGGGWQQQPGWEPGFGFGGGGFTESDPSGFSDFFEDLFGGRAGPGGGFDFAMRGADQRAAITIDLATAHQGGQRTLTIQAPAADGGGARARKLNVRIPPGVTDGQHIRLRGQGEPGSGGAPSGDIILEVDIAPDARFSLEGRDIHYTLPVAPWEAALGATIEVPTLDGPVQLTVPAGTQSGQRLRLKGRGLGGKQRGNQYVAVRMVTPTADSDAAKATYQRMADEFDFNPREEA